MNELQKNFQSGMVILLFVYAVNLIELDTTYKIASKIFLNFSLSLKAAANVITIFDSTSKKMFF